MPKATRRSSVVVIEREELNAVSNAVWDLFDSCDYSEANERKMKWIKTILTIITTSLVHNDNYNYIAPASHLIYQWMQSILDRQSNN